jgi:hypothetical protein
VEAKLGGLCVIFLFAFLSLASLFISSFTQQFFANPSLLIYNRSSGRRSESERGFCVREEPKAHQQETIRGRERKRKVHERPLNGENVRRVKGIFRHNSASPTSKAHETQLNNVKLFHFPPTPRSGLCGVAKATPTSLLLPKSA